MVPIKPLILAPPSHPHVPPHPSYTSSSKPSQHRAVAPAAGPNRYETETPEGADVCKRGSFYRKSQHFLKDGTVRDSEGQWGTSGRPLQTAV